MYLQSDAFYIPIKSESVDLIITDPPFGINFTGKANNYNRKKTISEYVEEQYPPYAAWKTLSEIKRVLKPYGTAWIIMGWNNLWHWEKNACEMEFNQIGHVIWKYQFGVYTKKKPVTSHYHCLIYAKNKKTWTWNQQGYDEDVWLIKRPYRRNQLKYATRLPDELVENMIIRSSNEGDVIFDPFVGSGTVVRCSEKLNRIGIGSDLLNNKEFWI